MLGSKGSAHHPSGQSAIKSTVHHPDPNNDLDLNSSGFWLLKSDMFTREHLMCFQHVPNLVTKLGKIGPDELKVVSERMKLENELERKRVVTMWEGVVEKVKGV